MWYQKAKEILEKYYLTVLDYKVCDASTCIKKAKLDKFLKNAYLPDDEDIEFLKELLSDDVGEEIAEAINFIVIQWTPTVYIYARGTEREAEDFEKWLISHDFKHDLVKSSWGKYESCPWFFVDTSRKVYSYGKPGVGLNNSGRVDFETAKNMILEEIK